MAGPGRGYASAWANDGTSSQRLILRGSSIAGALLLGNQRLADPLRDLIEECTDISVFKSQLLRSRYTQSLEKAVMEAWRQRRRHATLA